MLHIADTISLPLKSFNFECYQSPFLWKTFSSKYPGYGYEGQLYHNSYLFDSIVHSKIELCLDLAYMISKLRIAPWYQAFNHLNFRVIHVRPIVYVFSNYKPTNQRLSLLGAIDLSAFRKENQKVCFLNLNSFGYCLLFLHFGKILNPCFNFFEFSRLNLKD